MKRNLPSCLMLLLAFAASAANAQAILYKWVGPDGKVNYTDKPPPASALRSETRPLAGGTAANGAELPFELAEAVKNHPVTLYTTANCIPCDEGRKLLGERGIPFSEKTVSSNDDIAQLKKVSNERQLPLLLIGRGRQQGFEPSNWNTALSAAGYPETNRLPRNFSNPQAEAAGGLAKPGTGTADSGVAGDPSASRTVATELPPPVGNAPPGFRF